MNTIRVNDIGTEIVLNCGIDISTATVRKIYAKSPVGIKKIWAASASGIDSVSYVLIAGDIDVSGNWQLQSYVEMPGGKWRGTWAILNVEN